MQQRMQLTDKETQAKITAVQEAAKAATAADDMTTTTSGQAHYASDNVNGDADGQLPGQRSRTIDMRGPASWIRRRRDFQTI